MTTQQKICKTSPTKTNPAHFCAYVDAGMTLFPCVGYSKVPARKGFLEFSFDPEFVPNDQSYGVLLKSRYLVIDCDPRSYREGDKPLSRLLRDLELPADLFKQTFTVKTPRGGYHIYFSKTDKIQTVTSLKDYPGLEFKSKFIMACGSYIDKDPKGNPINAGYRPVFHSVSYIQPVPQILLAKLLKPDTKPLELDTKITPDNPADINAFVQYCSTASAAVEGQNGDLRTFQAACHGRELGLSPQKTYDTMLEYYNPRCVPPWDPEVLKDKISNAYTYSTRTPQGIKSIQNEFPDALPKTETVNIKYQFDRHGVLKKTMFNLKMMFEYPTIRENPDTKHKIVLDIPAIGNCLKYDQFAHRVVWIKPAPWYKASPDWCDEDAIEFKSILSERLGLDFPTLMIHEVASVCASKRAFHPVREYLENCVWDGIPRIDNWLSKYCGALETEYTRFIGRKVLVAAVARVYRPGCKFDHVLVTEGLQGVGKSYMWEILTAPWFTDAPLHIQDKSAVEVMRGKWVIELAEMDALSKYESQTIKGFLSRTEDRCRLAYERKARSFPRQNVFVGSINPEQSGWLKDRTGNRRYWPLAVTKIDLKALKEVKDVLWAEALLAFEKGETLFVDDPKMQQLMREEVNTRMQEDPWFWLLEEYLHTHIQEYVTSDKIVVMPVELYTRCIGGNAATFKMPEANRISSILKTLGFNKTKSVYKTGYVYTKQYVERL